MKDQAKEKTNFMVEIIVYYHLKERNSEFAGFHW
jgi:hypothetical protein